MTVQFLLCFFFSSIVESAQPPTQRFSGMTRPDRHSKGGHGSLAFVIWNIPARTIDKIVLCELGADSPSEIMPKHQFCFHCLTPHLRGSTLLFPFAPLLV